MRWWERVGAWDETHRLAVDATGAALLALVTMPLSVALAVDQVAVVPLWSLALVAPLAWRRVRPAASAAAVFSVALAHLLVGQYLLVPVDLVVLVALYSVTVHGPPWAYRTALGGALAGAGLLGALLLADSGLSSPEGALFSTVAVALTSVSAFAVGLVRRSRRETIDALVDRARRLEVERDQQAQIATSAERTRIAREMHDIVAHSLSVIIAQADGGRYAAQAEPEAAVRSLTTIAETGRAALADMRRLLGVLRPPEPAGAPRGQDRPAAPATTPGLAGPPPPPDLLPQPAVADVEHLVAQVRASGLAVSLVRTGTPRTLPPGTGLTLYRICQEGLTNVLKHGGPGARATVLLGWAPSAVVLEVSDDGRGAAAASDGAGLGVLGMRERAAMLGGTIAVGPRPGGGYRVRVQIPLPCPQEP
ncbi:histidine kinase [Actinotalea sp.]|uniref:sensor histidine kinase n=1 Tax=Actinotalea sp. TaxID=1872145 RepID=UPI002B781DE5|nr:histidine kinase [Actinotalea sp.]HQY32949.1 histidine kinase [Actinotalea sp.]HRA50744.1 histidine kinase [Actinotalea sp.]